MKMKTSKDKKGNIYIEFDNGKKLSPKDIADIAAKIRKTYSQKEIAGVFLEYKFTLNDVARYRDIMHALAMNWDLFEELNDEK